MGLDTVELVVRFEDTFGVTIPDEVAAQLATPRKVTDYIMTQVAVSDQLSCLSQQAFYFLRGKFVPSLNVSRKDFSPKTQLENLIPLENRKLIWTGIKSEVGASAIPNLARPIWLLSLLTFITILAFVYAAAYAWNNLDVRASVVIFFGLSVAIAVGYGGAVVTRPLKRNFRRGYKRAGDLARYILLHSPHTFKREKRGWTREQVASVVREVIIDETGVKDFTEDSHFIDDMHLD